MNEHIRFQANRSFSIFGIDLLVGLEDFNGQIVATGKPIEFNSYVAGRRVEAPTLSLKDGEAQLLMDELWKVGIRPSSGQGSVGQLAATERHLSDMRTIVFDKLKIPQKENP
ncbi:hypothetical protein [Candidatus Manganitrophus noduliformans]|uniref:Uncharacterized protein n=1 Tax=Candidatus Manganitrophus noduliformans TaxID=2606439 RepID=A0A7X6I9W7_9BACT|nr:hypothetical protein [Candidatus Manganitrophus noduliformans]NKE69876.1 hypothetical protein [Candidatus Manganitrophus noduliformans]